MTLRAGIAALPDLPIQDGRVFEGLADTLSVFADGEPAFDLEQTRRLREFLDTVHGHRPETLLAMREALAADVGLRGCAGTPP